jgi:hypothetical protein
MPQRMGALCNTWVGNMSIMSSHLPKMHSHFFCCHLPRMHSQLFVK